MLNQLVSHLLQLPLQFRRYLVDSHGRPLLPVEQISLPGNHASHPGILVLLPDGDLQSSGVQAQLLADLRQHHEGVGAVPVQLVHEDNPRNIVSLHLPVHRHRLRLHPSDATRHQHRPVQHPQSPLHLDGEIDVTGCVDDVDVRQLVTDLPIAIGCGGGDGDASFPLQLHVIHLSPHTVLPPDIMDLLDPPGVEQDALGEGGLPGVDVRRDADVANGLELRAEPPDAQAARRAPGGPHARHRLHAAPCCVAT
mmetsp:Transcript_37269/g.97653  ORF Transcript_37269/g.97653 Transcript_37269/m.97653 type:complete len:252 (-) Transcript_37269:7-762(-)